jgi:type IV pilus assembly protein PilA
VIIIGILAAIAIPVFLAQRENAASAAARANIRTAGTAEQAAYTDTGSYVALTALGPHGFQAAGAAPPVVEVSQNATDYCFSATGGGDTWYMDHERGAPSAAVCT